MIGVDIAKHVFQMHGVSENEQPVLRRQLRTVLTCTTRTARWFSRSAASPASARLRPPDSLRRTTPISTSHAMWPVPQRRS